MAKKENTLTGISAFSNHSLYSAVRHEDTIYATPVVGFIYDTYGDLDDPNGHLAYINDDGIWTSCEGTTVIHQKALESSDMFKSGELNSRFLKDVRDIKKVVIHNCGYFETLWEKQ